MRRVAGHNIFISNLKEASVDRNIRDNNIKATISVCEKDTPIYSGVAQFKVKMSDPKTSLAKGNPLESAVEVFNIAKDLAEQRGGNILIHCVSGHNRSALVAALWLREHKNIGLEEAVEMTKVKDNKPWMKDFGLVW